MNTADQILQKHEDANEMHFHEVDRKFIIEAMEEYAKEKSEKPINLTDKQQTPVEYLINELPVIDWSDPYWKIKAIKAFELQKSIIINSIVECAYEYKITYDQAEEYYNQTYKTNKQ